MINQQDSAATPNTRNKKELLPSSNLIIPLNAKHERAVTKNKLDQENSFSSISIGFKFGSYTSYNINYVNVSPRNLPLQ